MKARPFKVGLTWVDAWFLLGHRVSFGSPNLIVNFLIWALLEFLLAWLQRLIVFHITLLLLLDRLCFLPNSGVWLLTLRHPALPAAHKLVVDRWLFEVWHSDVAGSEALTRVNAAYALHNVTVRHHLWHEKRLTQVLRCIVDRFKHVQLVPERLQFLNIEGLSVTRWTRALW